VEETSPETDFPTEIVKEGNVRLLVPKLKAFVKSPSEYAPSKAPVFYNPVMELNRDIAVLALQAYQRTVSREIVVCEPLAGCGAMGVRFAAEVKDIREVVMTDISVKASKLASQNVKINRLDKLVTVEHKEANALLSDYSAPYRRFDAIDLDPFGSPVPYLDSSIRALRNSGFLALTATDMAPLCGVHPKACIRKYGGKPLRTEYCHELAVRLLAGCLAATAAKHDIGINVVFSHSSDHYVRVYAIIEYGAKKADGSLESMGYILHCFECFHRKTARLHSFIKNDGKCDECGSRLSIAGPLWVGKILDKRFCELMEEEVKRKRLRLANRVEKMLSLMRSETDAPITYYVIDKLCDALSLPVPPVRKVAETLKREGYHALLTHFNTRGIRSDAPANVMKNAVREAVGAGGKF
jgi:tRNA (guanine26-N2/guanine27-N2)-dimethyltransferase